MHIIILLFTYLAVISMMFYYDLFKHKIQIIFHTVLLSQFCQYVGIYFNIRRISKFQDARCYKILNYTIYFVWAMQFTLLIIGFNGGATCSPTNIYPVCMQYLLLLYIPEFILIKTLNKNNYFKNEKRLN